MQISQKLELLLKALMSYCSHPVCISLSGFFSERQAEPDGNPVTTAHSSSAKKTVQDGEYGKHHFDLGGEGFFVFGRHHI